MRKQKTEVKEQRHIITCNNDITEEEITKFVSSRKRTPVIIQIPNLNRYIIKTTNITKNKRKQDIKEQTLNIYVTAIIQAIRKHEDVMILNTQNLQLQNTYCIIHNNLIHETIVSEAKNGIMYHKISIQHDKTRYRTLIQKEHDTTFNRLKLTQTWI